MNPASWRLTAAMAVVLSATAGCTSGPPGVDAVAVTPDLPATGPRVLVVVAHPDDEIAFGGVLYKTATHLDGACDVVTITNGEGGFKYSTLAESIYGLELTDPAVGRAELPAIRRAELVEGCRYLGVRSLYLLGQQDHRYTLDVDEVLDPTADVWDVPFVQRTLRELLERGGYDFVLTHTPVEGTHGHHKAATILALAAVAEMDEARRPVVLGVRGSGEDGQPPSPFEGLEGRPETAQRGAPFVFDRATKFGYRDRLDYDIVVRWAIAAHKSQGTMQLLMARGGGREHYFVYADSPNHAAERVADWFADLATPQFVAKTYDSSADARIPDR